MKLLLDENLSRRIVPALQGAFPGTTQIALINMQAADDRAVWNFAMANDFVIVTKDSDFADLQAILGFPPKLILLAVGNVSNDKVVETLVRASADLEVAFRRSDVGFVELF